MVQSFQDWNDPHWPHRDGLWVCVSPSQEDYELETARAETLRVQSSHLLASFRSEATSVVVKWHPTPSSSLENVTRESQAALCPLIYGSTLLGFGRGLTLAPSPVCIYVCAHVYVHVGICVCMHTKARGHPLELFLGICSL